MSHTADLQLGLIDISSSEVLSENLSFEGHGFLAQHPLKRRKVLFCFDFLHIPQRKDVIDSGLKGGVFGRSHAA